MSINLNDITEMGAWSLGYEIIHRNEDDKNPFLQYSEQYDAFESGKQAALDDIADGMKKDSKLRRWCPLCGEKLAFFSGQNNKYCTNKECHYTYTEGNKNG